MDLKKDVKEMMGIGSIEEGVKFIFVLLFLFGFIHLVLKVDMTPFSIGYATSLFLTWMFRQGMFKSEDKTTSKRNNNVPKTNEPDRVYT